MPASSTHLLEVNVLHECLLQGTLHLAVYFLQCFLLAPRPGQQLHRGEFVCEGGSLHLRRVVWGSRGKSLFCPHFWSDSCNSTNFLDKQTESSVHSISGWLSKNRDENSQFTHAHPECTAILNWKFCACVNSRRTFWTTNLKWSVHLFSGWLSQNSDENPRMCTF